MISITQESTAFTDCLYFHPTLHLLHNEETLPHSQSAIRILWCLRWDGDGFYLTQSISLQNSPLDISISPKFLLSYSSLPLHPSPYRLEASSSCCTWPWIFHLDLPVSLPCFNQTNLDPSQILLLSSRWERPINIGSFSHRMLSWVNST